MRWLLQVLKVKVGCGVGMTYEVGVWGIFISKIE